MLAIFNSLGGGEVIAILIIGLIVLGPEKLPDAIRKFGNIYGEFRRMSQGFQNELRDAFDEPLQSLRGTAQMMQDSVNQPLQSITDMTAPVVGGAATSEPVEVTATEAAATEVAAVGAPAKEATTEQATAEEATIEEVQAPVDDDEAPAGSAAASWAAERGNGPAPAASAIPAAAPLIPVTAEVEVAAEPDVREDEEPVLAEAGLLVSEPEMPTESSEDEERPG